MFQSWPLVAKPAAIARSAVQVFFAHRPRRPSRSKVQPCPLLEELAVRLALLVDCQYRGTEFDNVEQRLHSSDL